MVWTGSGQAAGSMALCFARAWDAQAADCVGALSGVVARRRVDSLSGEKGRRDRLAMTVAHGLGSLLLDEPVTAPIRTEAR